MIIVMSSHVNSQNEKISIESSDSGAFAGQLLLVMHDDNAYHGWGTKAPMLLDKSTITWLMQTLKEFV